MRTSILNLLIVIILSLSATPIHAELSKGLAAYKNGDYQSAYKEFYAASLTNNPDAIYTIGTMYTEGKGVGKDLNQAAIWFEKAAQLGHTFSQYNLANMYYFGQGVPQDYFKALLLYKKASDKGMKEAQYNAGKMFEMGLGVTQDYNLAAKLYESAGRKGDGMAQRDLAIFYAKGWGVPKDLVLALALLEISTRNGGEDCEKCRNSITDKLTLNEVNRAHLIAQGWVLGQPLPKSSY